MSGPRNSSVGWRMTASLVALTAAVLVVGCGQDGATGPPRSSANPTAAARARPVISVTVVTPQQQSWESRVQASGSVAAFEEIDLSVHGDGLPIVSVSARVGDRVRKGQVLARFDSEDLVIKRTEAQAAVAEANANLAEARTQLEGAQELDTTGSISRQELMKAQTQAKVSAARALDAQARLAGVELQLRNTMVRAPDDGVVTSSVATVGAVPATGAELFRLIRGERLEWRAQVSARDLANIRAGQPVQVAGPDGSVTTGIVRQIAPLLDKANLTGTVYVDLPAEARLQAGSFVSGTIATGRSPALTVPEAAITYRDGFHYALAIDADSRVHPVKLAQGRVEDRRVEVLAGLRADERVVASGVGFLNDGDLVQVVDAPVPTRIAGNESGP